MLNLDDITNISPFSWEAGWWPMDYDGVNQNGVSKYKMRWSEPETWKKAIELNESVYERWRGENDRRWGIGGLFHLTVLARYAHAQWGVVTQVVKMLWRLVMLQVWPGALCISENGKLGYGYPKLLKNWIQNSAARSSAEHASSGRSSPSLSCHPCKFWSLGLLAHSLPLLAEGSCQHLPAGLDTDVWLEIWKLISDAVNFSNWCEIR